MVFLVCGGIVSLIEGHGVSFPRENNSVHESECIGDAEISISCVPRLVFIGFM